MKLSEYAAFDAIGLARAMRRGDYSQHEVTEAAIAAIELLNPELNAVVIKNYEVARGVNPIAANPGPLAGVPFLLKDVNVSTRDMPTTYSCAFFKDAKPSRDSDIVTRWREAGLVVLGKTNTPEFAEDFVCEPSFRGPALNPWNASLTTGGSSGGAGSAVASGMVPIAHGTDLGGSIRIPAACCGVYGLKPSCGLSPVDRSYPELSNGLNSDHVLTRSVRDSAAVLDITARPLRGYRYPLQRPVNSYLESLEHEVQSLRIGVCVKTPTGEVVPDRQQQAVAIASDILSASGHQLVEYAYPGDLDFDSSADNLWMIDVEYEIQKHIAEVGREPAADEIDALTGYLRRRIQSLSAMDLHKTRLKLQFNSVSMMNSMADMDLLLTPALGADPIEVGVLDSHSDKFDYDSWAQQGFAFSPFSAIYNFSGQPAASIPVMVAGNPHPCAVQLAGQHNQDHRVLQISALLEKSLNWISQQAPVWAGNHS